MKKMTPRERVLTILSGGQPDQVPWFGDLDYWANSLIKRGLKPEGFIQSDDYIQWHIDLGVGFYLQGFFPFTEIIENCEITTWNDGNLRYRKIETPKGTLRECWQWLETSFSEGHKEYLVKSAADLSAYRHIIENTRYEADYDYAKKRIQQIGDQGALLCYTPRSPFMHMLAIDAGINNIMTIYMEDPEGFAETIELMKGKFTEASGKYSCIHMDGWSDYTSKSSTIMWGSIPGLYFTEKVTDAEFDRFITGEVLPVMRSKPQYVLGVADQVPPDGLERRVARVRELVDEHGKY